MGKGERVVEDLANTSWVFGEKKVDQIHERKIFPGLKKDLNLHTEIQMVFMKKKSTSSHVLMDKKNTSKSR